MVNTKLTEPLPRCVYDCTYTGTATPIISPLLNKSKYYEKLPNYYTPKSPQDPTLVFESRFESGNLHKAFQISEFEYDLEMKFDHGCPGQLTQWFYFRVANTKEGQTYRFNLINFYKPDSLYNHGMRPLLYSK